MGVTFERKWTLRGTVLPSKSSQNTPSMTQMGSGTFIPHRDSVRGFIYDVETGKLREVA